ncbi:MAG: hypothetical protein R2734_15500 [Nocardioides sp.]
MLGPGFLPEGRPVILTPPPVQQCLGAAPAYGVRPLPCTAPLVVARDSRNPGRGPPR